MGDLTMATLSAKICRRVDEVDEVRGRTESSVGRRYPVSHHPNVAVELILLSKRGNKVCNNRAGV